MWSIDKFNELNDSLDITMTVHTKQRNTESLAILRYQDTTENDTFVLTMISLI